MNKILQAGAGTVVAAALLLGASVASAQSVTGIPSVTFTPSTTVTAGTGSTVGTITVAGDAQGATITSLPLTVTGTGGATAGNLTNCQLFGTNGAALGSSFNPTGATSGFNFTTPLSVGAAAGTSTITVRCDVSSGLASGANFQFAAGTPTFANGLSVNFITVPSVPQGSANEALGIIGLDASRSGSAVTVTSLPITVSPNGAAITSLTNCSLRSIANIAAPISASATQNGSVMSFSLTNPLVIPAGSTTNLVIVCNVDPSTPVGSTFTVSLAPSQVVSTANGTTITPTGAIGSTGSALPTSGTIMVTAAGTGSGTGTGTGTGTGVPGIPNTGTGGNAFGALALLVLSGLLAVAGSVYFRRVSLS